MIKRDIVLRWTQELAKVISKLLGKETEEALEIIDDALVDQLELDPSQLARMTQKELLNYLANDKQLSLPQIEFVGNLFYERAMQMQETKDIHEWNPYFAKAYTLLDHVQNNADTYSLDRQQKLKTIQQFLQS